MLSNKQNRNSRPETTQNPQRRNKATCMLCVVQEERIELLDKLEQFPLKIRVKEEQEGILRLAGFCSFSAQMYLHLCLSSDPPPPCLAWLSCPLCCCTVLLTCLSLWSCKLILLPCSAATTRVMYTTWTQGLIVNPPPPPLP